MSTCSVRCRCGRATLLFAKVAALTTALLTTVLALQIGAGIAWPVVLNLPAELQTIPALTSDRPLPPVDAAGLQAVMDPRSRGRAEERRAGARRGRRYRDWRLHARRAARLYLRRRDAGVVDSRRDR